MKESSEKTPWTLKRSFNTRRLWITVQRDGSVVVTAPHQATISAIEQFIRNKAAWIARAVARMTKYKNDIFLPRDRRSYLAHKETARGIINGLLAQYAPKYGLTHKRVFIKNLRRNWGSCSEVGNLNFNYKIALLPLELAEYVVVHELCHLVHFNHSKEFWALVAQEIPDYTQRRNAMRKYHA